ncbi:VIT domain-containing protein [Chitinophagaceae bacterium LB-8]|uniref:VIT domain-containing protein n=1 Tax=Paraflavisolibacter caeni TaxID=2982496 RepID=A0A9X3B6W3_9BACT|nr:VIT domain-containing protein [Paraflavisolibacter caeni]MCU7548555.1 VIT domain-containing protein [Paraflavisolibacter caeni]
MRIAPPFIAFALMSLGSVHAQLPELTSSDKTAPIELQKLDICVKIIGTSSSTNFSMTFYNASDRVLEGTFVLPLPEGANVTRYALDINGRMREGVPVEKAKATEVFESVEKRKIDPGLLEKTEGNVFRTRVYPIPARGVRSIIIAYEQELTFNRSKKLLYHLPLYSKDTVEKFSLCIDVQQKGAAPELQSSPISGLDFMLQKGHYCAHEQREHLVMDKPLDISIAKLSTEVESFVQNENGAYYFYLQTFLPTSTKVKKLPQRLAVVWDNSLSGLYRNTEKEIKLLEAYLKRLGTATIQLYTLNNTFRLAGTYEVRDGLSTSLSGLLQKITYDGGTDYSAIRFPDADEIILFTDGLSTLSDEGSLSASHVVYTVTTSTKANYSVLRSIAEQNGGSFINLSSSSIEEAIGGLTNQSLRFLGIRKNKNVVEHYPSTPTTIYNGFSMAGKLDEAPTLITLQFGYGKAVAFEKEVQLDFDEYEIEEWDFSKLVAQKKIQELEKDYDHHKDEILHLGKQHSIVTQNTSLLVLEDVMDYVRHQIEPPLELRSEYKRLLRESRDELSRNQQNTLDNAIEYSNSLWEWYNTSFPVKKKLISKFTGAETMDHATSTVDTAIAIKADEERRVEYVPPPPSAQEEANKEREALSQRIDISKHEEAATQRALQGRVAGLSAARVQMNEVVVEGHGTRIRGVSSNTSSNRNQLVIVDGKVATSLPPQQQIERIETMEPKAGIAVYGSRAMNGVLLVTSKGAKEREEPQIKLQEKASSVEYLKMLSKTPRNQQYQVYLELRDKNLLNPTFYYDIANFFLKQDKALGLQVLTNLGELDYQNHELLKLLGFKLKEQGEPDIQQFVFKKILLWRPQEPQSYRDYALALAEKGNYQAALDTLYLALTKEYNSDVMNNYEGIEETIVTEINHLISRYKSHLNTSAINKKLIYSMPVDIRVVLNWNMNDTDIDLWVTDPSGEKCFYSQKETRIGGRISDDFTDGYGPEQFLLKKAPKGKYKIQVDYYGESGVKVAGKTTLLVEVFTNYGRSTEQRKVITLQLEGGERDGVYVGEFLF